MLNFPKLSVQIIKELFQMSKYRIFKTIRIFILEKTECLLRKKLLTILKGIIVKGIESLPKAQIFNLYIFAN